MSKHRHDGEWSYGLLLAAALAVVITLLVLELGWAPDWHDDVEQRLDALEQEVGE